MRLKRIEYAQDKVAGEIISIWNKMEPIMQDTKPSN